MITMRDYRAWFDYVTVGYIHVADVLVQHFQPKCNASYCQTSDISRTLAGNKIVDDSDVAGEKHLRFGIWCLLF